jgi:hypothetical protein
LKASKFKLSPQDQEKHVWKQVEKYIEETMQKNREANDKPLDEIKTATLRGKNEQLRAMLNAFVPKQLNTGGQRGRSD